MRNSVSDRSICDYSDDEHDVEEHRGDDDLDGGESDGSDSSSSPGADDPRNSLPESYNTTWPQSYRQSMDMLTNVASPSIEFLRTASLSRLGSSFIDITSSFRAKHPTEVVALLIKPLLPAGEDEHHRGHQRLSSHSLLPPAAPKRRSSSKIIRVDDGKPYRSSAAAAAAAAAVSHGPASASRQSSYGQAVLNGINCLCGVGILSTPYAVRIGGWLGLLILLLLAALSYYTGLLLRRCLDSTPGLESYPDIGQAAFGTKGRFIVSIILYMELYTCCVEYIILESDNLSSLFPNAHLSVGGLHLNAHTLFAVLSTLFVLPTTWLRDLSFLSYISAGGVVASILVSLCLFWVGLIDRVGFQGANLDNTLNLSGLPIAIGLYGYCYSGHAVFPNIYTSMKKPNEYPSVLFTTFVISTFLPAAVAVLGYLMFGDSTLSQFTLNLPQQFVASKVGVWTTVVNPVTKYALTLTPLALSLEELIPANRMKSHSYAILIRSALVISTLAVALSVPFFGLVMAFIGSFLVMLVALILPCACYLGILEEKVTLGQRALCILIIIVGVICAAFGTTSAVSKIISQLKGQ